MKFEWIVEVCELLGDQESLKVNRNNVKICSEEMLKRGIIKKVLLNL